MMNGYKTYVGLLVAALPTVLDFFGYTTAPGFSEQATQAFMELWTLVGLGMALYGRLKAQVPGWFAKK